MGFRPCVFRLATELGLTGWVNNSPQGVTVEVEGSVARKKFILRLEPEKPPLSFIRSLETSWLAPAGYSEFTIRESDSAGAKPALVLPDIAPARIMSGRFRPGKSAFPLSFTNCTNCGPRFTIIESLPYDRPNTSMREFCHVRRVSSRIRGSPRPAIPRAAQCLPVCGPHLELWDGKAGCCTRVIPRS